MHSHFLPHWYLGLALVEILVGVMGQLIRFSHNPLTIISFQVFDRYFLTFLADRDRAKILSQTSEPTLLMAAFRSSCRLWGAMVLLTSP